MSQTLQVSDGHIVISRATGQLATVEGNRKASQDLAEALLQDYLPDNDTGSYLSAILQNQDPDTGELMVRHYVADAVTRLQARQLEDPALTTSEAIADIDQLYTLSSDQGTLGFYVECSTEDGGESVKAAAVQPTSLNQLTEGF